MSENEYFLRPGYIFVNKEPSVVSTVLGSCVALFLWDKKNRFGGVNHYVYPVTGEKGNATCKYGNIAIKKLIAVMKEMGTSSTNLEAQIFGGASKEIERSKKSVGVQNVALARVLLKRYNIPVTSEDVEGTKGRKVIFRTGFNEVVVMKVETIRSEDWIKEY